MKRFCWKNVLDDMCRMGRDHFDLGLTVDANQSTFDKDMREKRFLHFLFSLTLTFDL